MKTPAATGCVYESLPWTLSHSEHSRKTTTTKNTIQNSSPVSRSDPSRHFAEFYRCLQRPNQPDIELKKISAHMTQTHPGKAQLFRQKRENIFGLTSIFIMIIGIPRTNTIKRIFVNVENARFSQGVKYS